jgi:hypothetical protein
MIPTSRMPSRSAAADAQAMKERILSAVAAQPSLTRAELRGRRAWLAAAGVVAALGTFALAGGLRVGPRPNELVLATATGSALLAALAMLMVMAPGRGQLGRSRAALWAVATLIPLALIAWKVGVSSAFDGMSAAWPTRPGLRCLRLELAIGAGPLALGLLAWRRTDPVHPFTFGAALGAALGVGAAVLVDLWCPVAYVPHLLLGHLVPVAALAGLGALGGLALRLRSP